MPIRIVRPDEAPRSEKKTVKRFESTRLWKQLKKELDQGYPNAGGLIDIALTSKEMGEMDIKSVRTVVRFVQTHFRENGLTHKVKVRRASGIEHVIIESGAKPKK